MIIYYHVYDDFCKPGYIEGDLDRFVVDHLLEPINHDQNKVITATFPFD